MSDRCGPLLPRPRRGKRGYATHSRKEKKERKKREKWLSYITRMRRGQSRVGEVSLKLFCLGLGLLELLLGLLLHLLVGTLIAENLLQGVLRQLLPRQLRLDRFLGVILSLSSGRSRDRCSSLRS